jgi:hypothetical protein
MPDKKQNGLSNWTRKTLSSHPVSLYWDYCKRDEAVEAFNELFGASVK